MAFSRLKSFIPLIALSMLFTYCGDDGTVEDTDAACDNAVGEFQVQLLSFDPDNFTLEECNGLKDALVGVLNTCDASNILADLGITQQAWEVIIDEVESFECSACLSAFTTIGTAATELTNNPESEAACLAYQEAVANADAVCDEAFITEELNLTIEEWEAFVADSEALDCTP